MILMIQSPYKTAVARKSRDLVHFMYTSSNLSSIEMHILSTSSLVGSHFICLENKRALERFVWNSKESPKLSYSGHPSRARIKQVLHRRASLPRPPRLRLEGLSSLSSSPNISRITLHSLTAPAWWRSLNAIKAVPQHSRYASSSRSHLSIVTRSHDVVATEDSKPYLHAPDLRTTSQQRHAPCNCIPSDSPYWAKTYHLTLNYHIFFIREIALARKVHKIPADLRGLSPRLLRLQNHAIGND